jgi:Interferon-induced transmembrane protein/zinc-ribbon domain
MYCTKCGTSRPDGMTTCANCGTAAIAFAEPPKIQNYLVQSILVTLCCCIPAGIVAIIYAAQVNSKLAAGDIQGAQASARLAKIWSWVGFGLGVVLGIIYAIAAALGSFNNVH